MSLWFMWYGLPMLSKMSFHFWCRYSQPQIGSSNPPHTYTPKMKTKDICKLKNKYLRIILCNMYEQPMTAENAWTPPHCHSTMEESNYTYLSLCFSLLLVICRGVIWCAHFHFSVLRFCLPGACTLSFAWCQFL